MEEKFYAGIDGGGTKTKFVIYTNKGNKVYEHDYMGCNLNQIDINEFNKLLSLIDIKLREYNVEVLVFGIPGYGEYEKLDKIVNDSISKLSIKRYSLYNDVDIAQFGANNLSKGIHVVAGTGSIAVKYSTLRQRTGGFGPLIGDEGSAYWIGCEALNHLSRFYDLRGNKSKICKYVEPLGITDSQSLIDYVYRNKNNRVAIADISKCVDKAAINGDMYANKILKSAAIELVNLIKPLIGTSQNTTITYSGSVFNSIILKNYVHSELSKLDCKLEEPYYTPAQGAALMAMKIGGEEIKKVNLEE